MLITTMIHPAPGLNYHTSLRFLSFSIHHSFLNPQFITTNTCSKTLKVTITNSSSFTAKSSSELRKHPSQDDKLGALRRLFSNPPAIHAYIIPSQDAHQVVVYFPFSLFSIFLFYFIFRKLGLAMN